MFRLSVRVDLFCSDRYGECSDHYRVKTEIDRRPWKAGEAGTEEGRHVEAGPTVNSPANESLNAPPRSPAERGYEGTSIALVSAKCGLPPAPSTGTSRTRTT